MRARTIGKATRRFAREVAREIATARELVLATTIGFIVGSAASGGFALAVVMPACLKEARAMASATARAAAEAEARPEIDRAYARGAIDAIEGSARVTSQRHDTMFRITTVSGDLWFVRRDPARPLGDAGAPSSSGPLGPLLPEGAP